VQPHEVELAFRVGERATEGRRKLIPEHLKSLSCDAQSYQTGNEAATLGCAPDETTAARVGTAVCAARRANETDEARALLRLRAPF
jgi:hypothetical protein